jgi:hypothetical protein
LSKLDALVPVSLRALGNAVAPVLAGGWHPRFILRNRLISTECSHHIGAPHMFLDISEHEGARTANLAAASPARGAAQPGQVPQEIG